MGIRTEVLLLISILVTANCLSKDDPHPDFHHKSKVVFKESSAMGDPLPHHVHPMPPVAMPGILKEFDQAAVKHKRKLLTELRALQNRKMIGQEILRRKRGMVFPKRIPYKRIRVNRNKRDLRRLRRDLSYEMTYALPDFPMEKRQLGVRPVTTYHSSPPSQQIDLESLLESVDLLDRLSILNQVAEASSNPVMPYPEKHRSRHASASRFAPQPVLFQGQAGPRLVKEVVQPWDDASRRGKLVWNGEKRSANWNALSMVPGFKRSSFREAERMNFGSYDAKNEDEREERMNTKKD